MSESNLWKAPYRGANPISAVIEIPGSKSVTNRALILAAIAKGPSILRKPLHSRDSALMIGGLKALGCEINQLPNGDLEITPGKLSGPAKIDVGNAGTVMRFLPPVAALATGVDTLDVLLFLLITSFLEPRVLDFPSCFGGSTSIYS